MEDPETFNKTITGEVIDNFRRTTFSVNQTFFQRSRTETKPATVSHARTFDLPIMSFVMQICRTLC